RIIQNIGVFNGFFFIDGVYYGIDLTEADKYPLETGDAILNSRIVYTPHCYGIGIIEHDEFGESGFPENLDEIYKKRYGFLTKKGYPVLIGEWGGRYIANSTGETWNLWFAKWLRTNCLTKSIYWSLDPKSWYTPGLLANDYKTPFKHRLAQ
ncbi:hypothetical protein PMAYCL1PPCAC_22270, partial [Pristionchus mayeri]